MHRWVDHESGVVLFLAVHIWCIRAREEGRSHTSPRDREAIALLACYETDIGQNGNGRCIADRRQFASKMRLQAFCLLRKIGPPLLLVFGSQGGPSFQISTFHLPLLHRDHQPNKIVHLLSVSLVHQVRDFRKIETLIKMYGYPGTFLKLQTSENLLTLQGAPGYNRPPGFGGPAPGMGPPGMGE